MVRAPNATGEVTYGLKSWSCEQFRELSCFDIARCEQRFRYDAIAFNGKQITWAPPPIEDCEVTHERLEALRREAFEKLWMLEVDCLELVPKV